MYFTQNAKWSQFLVLDDVLAEFFKVHLIVSVGVTLFDQFVNQVLILSILLLVGLKHDGQLLPANPSVMIYVEVVEGKFQVISVVGCWFGQAGRDKLIIGESAVVIDIHVPDYFLDILVVRVVVVLLEVLR